MSAIRGQPGSEGRTEPEAEHPQSRQDQRHVGQQRVAEQRGLAVVLVPGERGVGPGHRHDDHDPSELHPRRELECLDLTERRDEHASEQ